jgi:hypothetical protein
MSLLRRRNDGIDPGCEKGFALITAILAIMILMALGFLGLTVTTGDLKITGRVVGEKKAQSAAETGIHRMIQNFDPFILDYNRVKMDEARVIDAAKNPPSSYTIGAVTPPASGPDTLPLTGFSIGGGQQWGQRRYVSSVTGVNTNYNSSVTIDVGMGYGPIEVTTMSR